MGQTWVDRIGAFARSVIVLALDLITIGSELAARTVEFAGKVARAADQYLDDLRDALETKPTPPPPP